MNLVEILRQLTAADGRATRELPRGLHLVYYPALTNAAGEPVSRARLIAGRHVAVPSLTELRIVRDALLEALDAHPTRVVVGLDEEWRDVVERNDWNGYSITWHMLPIGQAFGDTDQADRIRRALEQREERADERRRHSQRSGRRPANAQQQTEAAAHDDLFAADDVTALPYSAAGVSGVSSRITNRALASAVVLQRFSIAAVMALLWLPYSTINSASWATWAGVRRTLICIRVLSGRSVM